MSIATLWLLFSLLPYSVYGASKPRCRPVASAQNAYYAKQLKALPKARPKFNEQASHNTVGVVLQVSVTDSTVSYLCMGVVVHRHWIATSSECLPEDFIFVNLVFAYGNPYFDLTQMAVITEHTMPCGTTDLVLLQVDTTFTEIAQVASQSDVETHLLHRAAAVYSINPEYHLKGPANTIVECLYGSDSVCMQWSTLGIHWNVSWGNAFCLSTASNYCNSLLGGAIVFLSQHDMRTLAGIEYTVPSECSAKIVSMMNDCSSIIETLNYFTFNTSTTTDVPHDGWSTSKSNECRTPTAVVGKTEIIATTTTSTTTTSTTTTSTTTSTTTFTTTHTTTTWASVPTTIFTFAEDTTTTEPWWFEEKDD